MKGKQLLAAFLLAVGLCFVPALGYGEIEHEMRTINVSYLNHYLLNARVNYMMHNPTTFLNVTFLYDPDGTLAERFPGPVATKNKIYVAILDTRRKYTYKTETALKDEFKRNLEAIYTFIDLAASDMDTDIVAIFYTREKIPLGYFHQGEYHLWER